MSTPAPITPLPPTLAADRPGTIIVVGGTFDPPHRAHVDLPTLARDRVEPGAWLLYVPAARSPFKADPPASPHHRAAMLALALRATPRAAVWTDEADRAALDPASPSYTIDTLRRLRTLTPARQRLLIGSDQAASFHRWREARALLDLAPPLVLLRWPHQTPDDLLGALGASGAWTGPEVAAWASRIAPVAPVPMSATDARAALAAGRSAPIALDPEVERYAHTHALYAPRG